MIKFELIETKKKARLGKIYYKDKVYDTPMFMPVGTNATVKSLTPDELIDMAQELSLE